MVLSKVDSHMQKNELGSLHHIQKLIPNELKTWMYKPETVKRLEENIMEMLCDIEFGSDFLAMTPKAQAGK